MAQRWRSGQFVAVKSQRAQAPPVSSVLFTTQRGVRVRAKSKLRSELRGEVESEIEDVVQGEGQVEAAVQADGQVEVETQRQVEAAVQVEALTPTRCKVQSVSALCSPISSDSNEQRPLNHARIHTYTNTHKHTHTRAQRGRWTIFTFASAGPRLPRSVVPRALTSWTGAWWV